MHQAAGFDALGGLQRGMALQQGAELFRQRRQVAPKRFQHATVGGLVSAHAVQCAAEVDAEFAGLRQQAVWRTFQRLGRLRRRLGPAGKPAQHPHQMRQVEGLADMIGHAGIQAGLAV